MRTFWRVTIGLLVLGTIAALGFGVWNAGYQQGLVETVDTANQVIVTQPYPGYYGFGVVGLMFKLIFAFIFFGFIAKLFFGRRHWRTHMAEGGSDHYRSRMEEKMTRWHDEAHGAKPESRPDDS